MNMEFHEWLKQDCRDHGVGGTTQRAFEAGKPKWLPIETAPKNERIILFNMVTGQYIAQWCSKEKTWPMGVWGTNRGEWTPKATHWMHLPELPK